MIHARKDYNRIQDPGLEDSTLLGKGCSPIAVDEPVFLLRAKDELFVPIMKEYIRFLNAHPDQNMAEFISSQIENHIILAEQWQDKNYTHMPSSPME